LTVWIATPLIIMSSDSGITLTNSHPDYSGNNQVCK
jgi:hypothetical protein